MTILETHISLRLHRPTKNLKTNLIFKNSHIYWLKYHSVHHSSKICDLLPQEKGNQWWTNTIVYLFSLLYFNYLHIITTQYIDIIWHLNVLILLECVWVYYLLFLLLIIFTFVYPFHLLWQCKYMFLMPIKPSIEIELRESWELTLREGVVSDSAFCLC
jgi:hypothetical protein